jgi:hypothetical protein
MVYFSEEARFIELCLWVNAEDCLLLHGVLYETTSY